MRKVVVLHQAVKRWHNGQWLGTCMKSDVAGPAPPPHGSPAASHRLERAEPVMEDVVVPITHTQLELVEAQLRAIEMFHRTRKMREETERAVKASRESRMMSARTLDALRRQHA